MNRCQGTRRDGAPCTVMLDPPQTLCWWHDPAFAEERRVAASRGGRRAGKGRPQTELQNVKVRLSDLAADVLEGKVDKSVGAVVSQILNVYLKAISVELDARDQLEHAGRLEAMEEALARDGDRPDAA